MSQNIEQVKTLPQLARKTVEEYINTGKIISPENIDIEDYKNKQAGVFVTLKINGNLRGCIGTISPTQENIIIETIINAISASTRDTRFNKVTQDELKDISYSVSLLMPPELIDSKEQLNPQEYGVIVESGYKRGLLLPRLEKINTVDEQLYYAMMKAGITQNENIRLYRFKSIEIEE